jgi:hypothetical protein
MAHISESLRQQVIDRARGRCEYCQTQQAIVVSMEIDHIVPQSANGVTELDNLCLACIGCNGYKQDFQTAFDPETQIEVALFHPRHDSWSQHFRWSDDATILNGISSQGRATVQRLKMNRATVCEARKLWAKAGWHPPQ